MTRAREPVKVDENGRIGGLEASRKARRRRQGAIEGKALPCPHPGRVWARGPVRDEKREHGQGGERGGRRRG